MTPTQLSPSSTARQGARRKSGIAAASAEPASNRWHRSGRCGHKLGTYTDRDDRSREVIAQPTRAGSVLVLDRDSLTRGDSRLVAHLGADEPLENAAVICQDYLRDEHVERRRCRRVTVEDARTSPFPESPRSSVGVLGRSLADPTDRLGCVYRLERLDTGMSIPELRWCRRSDGHAAPPEPVSLREAIARLQSYEPLCALTERALAEVRESGDVSSTVLRAELGRVLESPIVLNRGLREAVVERVQRDEVSMSEIAMRCGRVKRDGRGNASGETSWLARRIGMLPDGGQDKPTPWIHSDVLGLIARKGLGISPREVEL